MRINELAVADATVSAAQAAQSRRSIRVYDPTAIPEAELLELLRLAGRAPSAYNAQPWRFVVVRDPALKERLSAAAYGQKQVLSAPATIVVYSDMENALARMPESAHPAMPSEARDGMIEGFRRSFDGKSVAEREEWGNSQSNIALGYLLLLAETMGFATSPMLGFDAGQVKTLLGLPAHVRVPALVTIGYAAEEGFPPHRLDAETMVEFR